MVHWIFACFVFLMAVYQVKATSFSFCSNFILTSPFYDSVNHQFNSQIAGDSSHISPIYYSDASALDAATSCSSTYMNKYSWMLLLPYTSCVSGTNDFGLGFWVNFVSTIGTDIVQFGTSDGYPNTYRIHSDTEGVLKWDFVGDYESSLDSNDFSITVPITQWTFMAFHWSGSTIDIYLPGKAWVQKSAAGSYPFKIPSDGYSTFGNMVQGYIYQFLGFKSVKDFQDGSIIIPLFDGTNTYEATATCNSLCSDTVCHPTVHCLSSVAYCSKCNAKACTECSISSLLPATYCNPSCPSNCAKCSSTTLCTQCNSGYFLYDNAGQTSCIFCDTSCSTCNPGPTCYECAESIVKDGSACRVDKIGYQISFSTPNIEIDFAHPLASDLIVSNLGAKTAAGSAINTDHWTLTTCKKGASSCTIVTDLSQDDLPIEADFKFNEA